MNKKSNTQNEFLQKNINNLSVSELKKQLVVGDIKLIADVTHFTADYAKKVLCEDRKNEVIIEATRMLLKDRQSFYKKVDLLKKEFHFKRFEKAI